MDALVGTFQVIKVATSVRAWELLHGVDLVKDTRHAIVNRTKVCIEIADTSGFYSNVVHWMSIG